MKQDYFRMKVEFEKLKVEMKLMQDKMEEQAENVKAAEEFLIDGEKGFKVVDRLKKAKVGSGKQVKEQAGQRVGKAAEKVVKGWEKLEVGSSKPIFVKVVDQVVDQDMEVVVKKPKEKSNPPIFLKEIGRISLVKEALARDEVAAEFKSVQGDIIILSCGGDHPAFYRLCPKHPVQVAREAEEVRIMRVQELEVTAGFFSERVRGKAAEKVEKQVERKAENSLEGKIEETLKRLLPGIIRFLNG